MRDVWPVNVLCSNRTNKCVTRWIITWEAKGQIHSCHQTAMRRLSTANLSDHPAKATRVCPSSKSSKLNREKTKTQSFTVWRPSLLILQRSVTVIDTDYECGTVKVSIWRQTDWRSHFSHYCETRWSWRYLFEAGPLKTMSFTQQ